MTSVTPNPKMISDPIPMSMAMPSGGGEAIVMEDESFVTVEEIIPRNPSSMSDFQRNLCMTQSL